MSLEANELLEKLELSEMNIIDPQKTADSLAGGCTALPLHGDLSCMDIIADQLIPEMPEAAAEIALNEQKLEELSLTSETKPEMS